MLVNTSVPRIVRLQQVYFETFNKFQRDSAQSEAQIIDHDNSSLILKNQRRKPSVFAIPLIKKRMHSCTKKNENRTVNPIKNQKTFFFMSF